VNVDFAYVKEALAGLRASLSQCASAFSKNTHFRYNSQGVTLHGPLTQSVFLTRMGLNVRVEELKRVVLSNERKEAIDSAAKRLVDLVGMGREYLVLGITGEMDDESSKVEGAWPFVEIT
jgi:NADH dehydrogenase [ubiquinone] 1 alpha subcomplex assembly factor 7